MMSMAVLLIVGLGVLLVIGLVTGVLIFLNMDRGPKNDS
jgi:hypothetical protein